MTVANGIFSDNAFTLNPEYTKNTQKYLNSEVKSVDFSGNPASGESEVNKWVNSKTNGKISGIFKPGNDYKIIVNNIIDVWVLCCRRCHPKNKQSYGAPKVMIS